MAMKMLIDATHAEETRVVVVDGTKVEEFDFETANRRQIAGNIYLAKITRVEPSLQAAFVDYGGNRHGFLAFAEIHPDYYQIPAADREALKAEERADAEAQEAEEERGRSRRKPRAERAAAAADEVVSDEAGSDDASGDGAQEGSQDAADKDDEIESVADEDVTEEVRAPRKPRARRYKIQEVVKVRQIMLVQVVKEERGNKGAALTTYLSLPGRYCVLMPNTARGGGISRKITNAADRKKLKDIAGELDVPKGAGLIIRTAGSERTRTEIRRDYEYLLRLWEQIRELTFRSMAPAAIYEEGDLIKRNIRDLYSKEIDEVLVEGERGYRAARDFMQMIMPTHSDSVKHYQDQMPLFARFQVESYLAGMFNPVVQLKSGGYIVIGITEALVAIDVNSGRATKEGSIEETALKTNLEAADEVARQLRLRDLAGLIVIDFIDMDERRNNAAVEKRIKDKLKSDRARIQIGRISGFGLMEMSRQRLRPGMLESTTQPCAHCHGTGLIRSDDSLALTILRAIEDEGTRKRSREVLVKAPVAVANFLMNAKREHVAGIEARYGLSVRVEADPTLVSPDFAIEKFKTATRVLPEPGPAPLGVNADLMASIDEEEDEEDSPVRDDDAPRAPSQTQADSGAESGAAGGTDLLADAADVAGDAPGRAAFDAEGEEEGEGRGRRRRRRRRRKPGDRAEGDEAQSAARGRDSGDDASEDGISEDGATDEGATGDGDAGQGALKAGASDDGASDLAAPDGAAANGAPEAGASTDAPEAAPRDRSRTRSRSRSRKPVEVQPLPEVVDLASPTGNRAEALPDRPAAPASEQDRAPAPSAAAPQAPSEGPGTVQTDAAPAATPRSDAAPATSQSETAQGDADTAAAPQSAADPADAMPAEATPAAPMAELVPAEAVAEALVDSSAVPVGSVSIQQAPVQPSEAANAPGDAAPASKRRGWWSGR